MRDCLGGMRFGKVQVEVSLTQLNLLEEGKKLWQAYFANTDVHIVRAELKLNRKDVGCTKYTKPYNPVIPALILLRYHLNLLKKFTKHLQKSYNQWCMRIGVFECVGYLKGVKLVKHINKKLWNSLST